ncbi:MAG TPA: molybdopterin-dependent oxidoreductase [Stellaceae bacterium]|nr:molybdopterin-dependent oxidoreductase [Stellaceae bacterium]
MEKSRIVRAVCGHDCPDMCSLMVTVEDGRVARIAGDPEQEFTAGFVCGKVGREPELINSAARLTMPLLRRGAKGAGEFQPIGWDEALDRIAGRWREVIAAHGPAALVGYAYSGHMGKLNIGLPNGLFEALGAGGVETGTVCDSTADAAFVATLGEVGGADPEGVAECDLILAWGADLVATNVHFWALAQQARDRGAAIVVIDPQRTRTALQADWHLRPHIGSDAALAFGVMHVLLRDGLADRAYLERATQGFDELEREVLPRFTPEAAAGATGIPAADIERLARTYAAARKPYLRFGLGMTRNRRGADAMRAVAILPAVVGAYGKPGAGALYSCSPAHGLPTGRLSAPTGATGRRMLNHATLGREILELADPPVRAFFVAANNPAVTCPDSHVVRRALGREDLFVVVHAPTLNDTARFADIVLPAATYLETDDLYTSYGSYRMQFGAQAVEPPGEARSNAWVARALARRMGVEHPVFRRPDRELLTELIEGATGLARGVDPEEVLSGRPIKLAPPDVQEFGTPSGRLEVRSSVLEAAGLPGLPDWRQEPGDPAHPLRLLTAPGFHLSHTAYAGARFLEKRAGESSCVLHPEDAAARGVADGDLVDLRNARGRITFRAKVGSETLPGVVLVIGQRPAADAASGTINMLCGAELTAVGAGATYQDTWLEVELHAGV